MWKSRSLKTALWVMGIMWSLFILSGCATQRVLNLGPVAPRTENPSVSYTEGYQAGKRDCESYFIDALTQQVELLRKVEQFRKFVDGGFIIPPEIKEVFVPGELSKDGRSFIAPRTEWVIVGETRFEPRSFFERLVGEKAVTKLLLTTEQNENDCYTFRNKVDAKPGDKLKVLPFSRGIGCVVIVELGDESNAAYYMQQYRARKLN